MADEITNPKPNEEVEPVPVEPTSDEQVQPEAPEAPAEVPADEPNASEINSPDEEKKPEKPKTGQGESRLSRWRNWYAAHKKISIPATIFITLLLLAAIPWTRYLIAGTVVKKDVSVQVMDATAHTPVSNAQVSVAGLNGVTDANGRASIHGVSAGPQNIQITKKYYETENLNITVPIFGDSQTQNVSFTATGRQVKIVITDLISGKKLKDASIKVADIEAKTDAEGGAVVVVPTGSESQKAILNAAGYNQKEVTLQTNSDSTKDNNFQLTPSGSIYFLSKRTGKLDVMRVNLDGSGTTVVIKGTGNENSNRTILMPSSDGKHVALLAQRAKTDKTPQLYVFATDDEKLFQADSGNAGFTLLGWSGSRLVYAVDRIDLKDFQLGKQKIKSYDADSGKITLLDQTEASDPGDGIQQNYVIHILSGETVVFAKSWALTSDAANLDDKRNSLNTIKIDGKDFKTVASFDTSSSVQYLQHSPVDFYVWQQPPEDAGKDTFYDFRIGQSPKKISLSADDFFEVEGQQYYISPSGNKSVWTEVRDGKSSFQVGDSSGDGAKEVASLEDFQAEGWFSDDYILASKKGSELYIMSADGSKPIKLADYQATYNYYY